MTRSIYLSSSRSEAMTSLAVTSWIEALGTRVFVKALEMVVEMARNERVVSLPPGLSVSIVDDRVRGATFENGCISRLDS